MKHEEVRGATIKVSGQCDLVSEIAEILAKSCEIVHTTRIIYHDDDDGCHRFFTVTEVTPE